MLSSGNMSVWWLAVLDVGWDRSSTCLWWLVVLVTGDKSSFIDASLWTSSVLSMGSSSIFLKPSSATGPSVPGQPKSSIFFTAVLLLKLSPSSAEASLVNGWGERAGINGEGPVKSAPVRLCFTTLSWGSPGEFSWWVGADITITCSCHFWNPDYLNSSVKGNKFYTKYILSIY